MAPRSRQAPEPSCHKDLQAKRPAAVLGSWGSVARAAWLGQHGQGSQGSRCSQGSGPWHQSASSCGTGPCSPAELSSAGGPSGGPSRKFQVLDQDLRKGRLWAAGQDVRVKGRRHIQSKTKQPKPVHDSWRGPRAAARAPEQGVPRLRSSGVVSGPGAGQRRPAGAGRLR